MKARDIFARLGYIWGLVFRIITVYYIYCIVIYSFDISISKGGRKNALVSMVTNSDSFIEYYAVDDLYGFTVDTEMNMIEHDVESVGSYETTMIPFCFTCGWYAPSDGFHILQPYKKGDILYTIEASEWAEDGLPIGTYETFNMKTRKSGYVESLNEIGRNADDIKYRVTKEFVMSNYDEISYSGYDDEDCLFAFITAYIIYGILLIWGIFAIIFRRNRAIN